jgi:hypothetical protein
MVSVINWREPVVPAEVRLSRPLSRKHRLLAGRIGWRPKEPSVYLYGYQLASTGGTGFQPAEPTSQPEDSAELPASRLETGCACFTKNKVFPKYYLLSTEKM